MRPLSLSLRVRVRAWDGINVHTKAAVALMSFPAFISNIHAFYLHLTLHSPKPSDVIYGGPYRDLWVIKVASGESESAPSRS